MSADSVDTLNLEMPAIIDSRMLIASLVVLLLGSALIFTLANGLDLRSRPIISINMSEVLTQTASTVVRGAVTSQATAKQVGSQTEGEKAVNGENVTSQDMVQTRTEVDVSETVTESEPVQATAEEAVENPHVVDLVAKEKSEASSEVAALISKVNEITSSGAIVTDEAAPASSTASDISPKPIREEAEQKVVVAKNEWVAGINNNGKVHRANTPPADELHSTLTPAMADAVDSGTVSQVLWLLSQGEHVNATDDEGESALLKASWNGDVAMIRALLDNAADVLLASDDGRTPIYAAVVSGEIPVVRLLLETRADVNAQTVDGRTPLMASASVNDGQIFSLLLESGADPNLIDDLGRNALFYGLWNSNMGLVNALVASGADVTLTDSLGQSAIGIARLRQISLLDLGLTEEQIELLNSQSAKLQN